MKKYLVLLLLPFVLGCVTRPDDTPAPDEPSRSHELYNGTFYDSGVENLVSLHPYFFSHALVEAIYQNFNLPESFSLKETAEMFGRFYYYAQNVDGAVIEIDSYSQGHSLYINIMPYNLDHQRQFRTEDNTEELGYLFWFNVSFEQPPFEKYTTDDFYPDNEPREKTLKVLYGFAESDSLLNLRYDYNLSESNSNLHNAWICIFDGIKENDSLALEYVQQARNQAEEIEEESLSRARYERIYSQYLYCEYHTLLGDYEEARSAHDELSKMLSDYQDELSPSNRTELKTLSESCDMTLILTEFLAPHYNG